MIENGWMDLIILVFHLAPITSPFTIYFNKLLVDSLQHVWLVVNIVFLSFNLQLNETKFFSETGPETENPEFYSSVSVKSEVRIKHRFC